VIELPQCDVKVPLVCRCCGNCCRNYYVPVDLESLPAISEILGEPIHAVQAKLNEKLDAHKHGRPGDCCFLKEDRCLIHAVKPEACRQFPSFTDAAAGNVDCPAHREYKKIERAFCREFRQAHIRRPSSSRKPRRVPDGDWEGIVSLVVNEGASGLFLEAFTALNEPQRQMHPG
jgi:Fe-S-cluster containining protein